MPDETQNLGADAPAGDAAVPTTDAAVGEAAVGADVGEDEFNPPNAIIVPTASGEEEVHVYSETGQDDAIIKPSGEIVRKVEGSGWDEYIEKEDAVEDVGEAPVDVAGADADFFDGTF
jgi:hypothetical protein